jgi:hypothetical protein
LPTAGKPLRRITQEGIGRADGVVVDLYIVVKRRRRMMTTKKKSKRIAVVLYYHTEKRSLEP